VAVPGLSAAGVCVNSDQMKNIFIGLAFSILLITAVCFFLQFSSLIVFYGGVSLVTLVVSFFIRHWSAFLAYLLPVSFFLLWFSVGNTLMLTHALPNMIIAVIFSYFVVRLVTKYRYTQWKWVIGGSYLAVTAAVIIFIIPATVINYAGNPDDQLLKLPKNFPLMAENSDTMDIQEKILVLEFWSSTCIPCLKQVKMISPVYEYYKNSGDVEVVAVNIGSDDYETALQSQLKQQMTMPSFFDGNKLFSEQLDLNLIPVLIIVDKNKHIRWKHVGYYKEEIGILNERIIEEVEKIRQSGVQRDAATIRSLP
jgi:thiol-disulfide isomerase/thioredoxin